MKFFLQLIQGNTRNISLLKYSFLQKLWTGCIIRPICRLQYLEVNVAAAETEFAKRCKQRAGMCAGALFGRILSERPTRPLETVFHFLIQSHPFPPIKGLCTYQETMEYGDKGDNLWKLGHTMLGQGICPKHMTFPDFFGIHRRPSLEQEVRRECNLFFEDNLTISAIANDCIKTYFMNFLTFRICLYL